MPRSRSYHYDKAKSNDKNASSVRLSQTSQTSRRAIFEEVLFLARYRNLSSIFKTSGVLAAVPSENFTMIPVACSIRRYLRLLTLEPLGCCHFDIKKVKWVVIPGPFSGSACCSMSWVKKSVSRAQENLDRSNNIWNNTYSLITRRKVL
jgi:hypothetical protein